MVRPDGIDGLVHLHGRARDVITGHDGTLSVLGEASHDVVVDFPRDRRVVSIDTVPHRAEVAALIGARASAGFRGEVDEHLSDERERRSLLYLLLDDVPVTTLVSGYAMGHAGIRPIRTGSSRPPTPNLCAGWQEDGVMMVEIGRTGRSPVVTGPPAPDLLGDDPDGWHAMPGLPPHGMRRARRLDVTPDDGALLVDAMFRDTHMAPDGDLTIVHEYGVLARLEADTLVISAVDATPRVLPWLECPAAADSARRLAGHTACELRSYVRRDLVGVSTCTHLNDLLRSLEDVVALAPLLSASTRRPS
jgi:hypothetical protein